MAIGTVKFFNPGKGFGFITPDSGAKDVFVPSASIATAGVALLKTGQRVSFEEMPDAKGPKAVNLKLLEAAPKPAPSARQADGKQVTLYCDPALDESEDIVAGLQDAGFEPLVVDYLAAPPSRDRLKSLSSLLRGTDQSLVRRYDPLFHELRLDDRFISENDFWDAIVEHPTLINGPVVAFAGRAAICRSPQALKAFLAPPSPDANGAQRKSLSPRLLKLMGQSAPEKNAPAAEVKVDAGRVTPAPAPMNAKPLATRPRLGVKAAAKAKPSAKSEPTAGEAKAAAKAPAKSRPMQKKSASKPAKKSRRG